MELWIRSQDKMNLVKIRQISLNYSNKKQIIANYTPESYENSGVYYELLGTYKTKERALEVLDEIQNILKPTIITTGYECELKENIKDKTSFNLDMIPTKTEIQELSTVVYQMPED